MHQICTWLVSVWESEHAEREKCSDRVGADLWSSNLTLSLTSTSSCHFTPSLTSASILTVQETESWAWTHSHLFCWSELRMLLRDAVVQLLRTLKPFFKFPSSFSPVREEKSRACAVRLLLVQLESESCACAVSCPCTVPLREAQLLKLWALFFFSLCVN